MSVSFPLDKPVNVYEVGAGPWHTLRSRPLWDRAAWRFTLIEPNPLVYADLALRAQAHPNVRVLGLACAEREGLHPLVLLGDRSFLMGVSSPMQGLYHGRAEEMWSQFVLPVYGVPFVRLDPGDIDLLYLSVEGAEWTVLRQLVSRPAIIAFPCYAANDYGYVMPHVIEAKDWLERQGYQPIKGLTDELATYVRTAAVKGGKLETALDRATQPA